MRCRYDWLVSLIFLYAHKAQICLYPRYLGSRPSTWFVRAVSSFATDSRTFRATSSCHSLSGSFDQGSPTTSVKTGFFLLFRASLLITSFLQPFSRFKFVRHRSSQSLNSKVYWFLCPVFFWSYICVFGSISKWCIWIKLERI